MVRDDIHCTDIQRLFVWTEHTGLVVLNEEFAENQGSAVHFCLACYRQSMA